MNELNINVAMADDHLLLMQGLTSILENTGFTIVIQAQNGKELIDKIGKAETLPDVCLLDIVMPVMGGLETIIILKRRWPRMPVVVLSFLDKPQFVTRMLMEGANGYLDKTCTMEQLRDAITMAHKNGIYFSELVTRQFWNAIKSKLIKLPYLTETELQVLRYCCTDLTYEEIAAEINMTTTTVTGRRDSIFKKLNIHSRTGLVKFAIENGIELVNIPRVSVDDFYS